MRETPRDRRNCLLVVGRINAERAWTAAACDRTHRAKPHTHLRGDRRETRQFWRVHEALRVGIAVAISRRVPSDLASEVRRTVTVASMTTSVEMVMRGLTTFARYLVRSVLVVCVMSLAAPCAAQEVDPPTLPDRRRWTWLAIRALGLAGAEHAGAETDRSQTLRVSTSANWTHQSHRLTSRFGRQSF